MTVITTTLNPNFNEEISECLLRLPECNEILSIMNPDKDNSISITFRAPTAMFDSHLWSNYHFFIIKCPDSESDFNKDDYIKKIPTDKLHKPEYIGKILKDENTFCIFRRKGLILSSS